MIFTSTVAVGVSTYDVVKGLSCREGYTNSVALNIFLYSVVRIISHYVVIVLCLYLFWASRYNQLQLETKVKDKQMPVYNRESFWINAAQARDSLLSEG